MADEFKEITTKSWGKRIIGSFMGVIFGIIIFVCAFPLIFWNEGRSVDRIRTLDEGRNLVIPISSEQIDPIHNNALIHFSGNAVTNDILKDPFFGVQENALKLKRVVHMYQWEETKQSKTNTNIGGSETTETTYSYDKVWSEKLINSANFKKPEGHENPTSMPYSTQLFKAEHITIGAFSLSPAFIQQMNDYEIYPLSQANYDAIHSQLKQSITLVGNKYFYGDPTNPHVGALRIAYAIIKPTEMSVVGKQDNNSLQTYYTKNGDISLLETGNVSAAEMFTTAESKNTIMTWLIRLGALVLMWLGLAMVLGPLKVLGDVVPIIGSIVGVGIGFVTLIVSLILSFATIAIAWLVFRPLIGVALFSLVGGIIFFGVKQFKIRTQKLDMNQTVHV